MAISKNREKETFTMGVEEEFQIIDPTTRELSPRNADIIREATMLNRKC